MNEQLKKLLADNPGKCKIRSIPAEIKVMSRLSKYELEVELWLMNDAVNRNNWRFTNIEAHVCDFVKKPILTAYINGGKTIGDGHNYRIVTDPETGEEKCSFTDASAERIVGTLSSFDEDFRLEVKDENTWIVAKGIIWTWYAGELVDKIESMALQGRHMEISCENLVYRCHNEGDIEVEDEWCALGVTILGDHVMPAVEGAKISCPGDIEKRYNELLIRAASYSKKSNSSKGVKSKVTNLSNKELTQLSTVIPGYAVLSGVTDGNGIYLALLGEDGIPAVYTMSSLNDTFAPERIRKIPAAASFAFGEDISLEVAVSDITDLALKQLRNANSEVKRLEGELSAAKAETEALRTAEHNRRIDAGKTKAKAVLSRFNNCRENKLGEDIIAGILGDNEAGAFADLADDKGMWIGEGVVEERVLAACARKVQEADESKVAAAKKTYLWNKVDEQNNDDGTIAGFLNRMGIE